MFSGDGVTPSVSIGTYGELLKPSAGLLDLPALGVRVELEGVSADFVLATELLCVSV